MQFLSMFAVFFVVWWITLFTVLPIGLRTQDEDGNVALGTVGSAPAKFRPFRVLLLNTVVALIVCFAWFGLSWLFDFSLDDLPQIMPDFRSGHS